MQNMNPVDVNSNTEITHKPETTAANTTKCSELFQRTDCCYFEQQTVIFVCMHSEYNLVCMYLRSIIYVRIQRVHPAPKGQGTE